MCADLARGLDGGFYHDFVRRGGRFLGSDDRALLQGRAHFVV